jgi:hypothetical protein
LTYTQVGNYVAIPVGTYTVNFVPAGSADCTAHAIVSTSHLTVNPASYLTIAALGLSSPPDGQASSGLALATFTDEGAGTNGNLRLLHASPGTPAITAQVVATDAGAITFPATSFANAPSGTGITNGYLEAAPFTGAAFQVTTTFAGDTTATTLVFPGRALGASEIRSEILLGVHGSATTPLVLLDCVDQPAAAVLASCSVVPAQ